MTAAATAGRLDVSVPDRQSKAVSNPVKLTTAIPRIIHCLIIRPTGATARSVFGGPRRTRPTRLAVARRLALPLVKLWVRKSFLINEGRLSGQTPSQ